ncbi:response regulator [Bradyrhizobium sp. CCBAU 11361]|uniref:response regulator n=1 Tax=Bradyrhizobium sp. CCBAU 11361 TaxID=1630812 RepID=UPI00230347F0|nr:response regulator [Bradyrhizobium sp. CCBAU 11361]MDA9491201.1 chemotaxis protein CheY [Bradyrhizobium sp. CCBAU 11361]
MADLAGLRVLVVEDEGGVALLIESMLEELGCNVTASVATLAKALNMARAETFDFAVLDVNLDGELVFPVAEILKARKLPFVFSTGYGRIGVPETFKECEVLNKPFTIEDFKTKLLAMLGSSRPSGDG